MHGLLDDEVAEIVAMYHEWAELDRSHRKLAHRGSYLERGVGVVAGARPG